MLPLTFANPADYDRIDPLAKVDIVGLGEFKPGKPLTLKVHNPDGSEQEIKVNHSFNESQSFTNVFCSNPLCFVLTCPTFLLAQIEWFKAGSALNMIRKKLASS